LGVGRTAATAIILDLRCPRSLHWTGTTVGQHCHPLPWHSHLSSIHGPRYYTLGWQLCDCKLTRCLSRYPIAELWWLCLVGITKQPIICSHLSAICSSGIRSPERSSFAYQQDASRRSSHPITSQPPRNSFSDALDASRGMVSLSQSDITPRNIYGSQGTSRSSTDSYGFPTTHSAHSSISSASYGANGYYAGDGSVTDYSSASESVDLASSRTLPRPSALLGASMPPAPQSMMGQFSSKVSSSSQKKHKCKICDKRFTRPSSLQTHMYSHTGEKPFACEVDGCGRHFSVVSNLRRHRKVHKNDGDMDHPSPDDA